MLSQNQPHEGLALACLQAAHDALRDIEAHYGFAPDWSPHEHYALMASIFTDPTAYAAA